MPRAAGPRRSSASFTISVSQRLRKTLAKRCGPVRLGNTIQRIRSVFKYGYDAELIDKPPRFGPTFKKPSAKVIRQVRAARGEQMFAAEQIHAVLAKSMPNTKAMVLLALNGGLGNTDLARLPLGAVDLKSGFPKTQPILTSCLLADEVRAIVVIPKAIGSPKNSNVQ